MYREIAGSQEEAFVIAWWCEGVVVAVMFEEFEVGE